MFEGDVLKNNESWDFLSDGDLNFFCEGEGLFPDSLFKKHHISFDKFVNIDTNSPKEKIETWDKELNIFLTSSGDEKQYQDWKIIWNFGNNIEKTKSLPNYSERIFRDMEDIFNKKKKKLAKKYDYEFGDKSLSELNVKESIFFILWILKKQVSHDEIQALWDPWNPNKIWNPFQKISQGSAEKNDNMNALYALNHKIKWVSRNYAEYMQIYFSVLKEYNENLTNVYCKYTSSKEINHAWNTFFIILTEKEVQCINIDPHSADNLGGFENWEFDMTWIPKFLE